MPIAARSNIKKELERLSRRADALGSAAGGLGWDYLPHQVPIFTCETRNIVLAKGRRFGGTRGATRWLVNNVRRHPGSRGLWVDVGYRQIIRYLKQYFFTLLRPLPPGAWKWHATLSQLEFANGSFIDFGSAERPELLEGAAYDYAVINEAGIVLRNADLYTQTLLPMFIEGDGARQLLNGTPKGLGLYHQLYLQGLGGDPEWQSFKGTSWDNPIVNHELLRRVAARMTEQQRRQEIYAEFIAAGGEFFQVVEEAATAPFQAEPVPGHVYAVGQDLGKAHDFTVSWVIDLTLGQAVWVTRYNRVPWPETIRRVDALSRKFGRARVYYDATGLGDVVGDLFAEQETPATAFVFSEASKGALLVALAAALEGGRFTFAPDPTTIGELQAFEQRKSKLGNYQYGAPPGGFDDTVIALALANHARETLGGENAPLVVVRGLGGLAADPLDLGAADYARLYS